MSWGSDEEGKPAGGEAGSTIDNECQAWWVRIRKFLGILVTDTTPTALGSGADEDNPAIKAAFVDDSTIEITGDTQINVKDAGITLAKHASDSVDENKIVSTTLGAGLSGGSGTTLSVDRFFGDDLIYAVPLGGSMQSGVDSSDVFYDGRVGFNAAEQNKKAFLGVNLPNGAVVTKLRAWCGSHTSGSVKIFLERRDSGGALGSMADVTLDAVENVSDSSISNATVNTATHTYGIEINAQSAGSNTLYVTRIEITYNLA